MGINQKMINIASELKAPKNQWNNFGKYKYRSLEDILEAVKPLLVKHGVHMNISDSIHFVGDRYYVEATITLSDGDDVVQVKAYAREEESKKGMDGSQITGTASTYARKYALGGAFLIDDTKDADADESGGQKKTEKMKCPKRGSEVWNSIVKKLRAGDVKMDDVKKHFQLTDKDVENLNTDVNSQ